MQFINYVYVYIFQKCNFCNVKGATIGCNVKKCKRTFHRECGLKHKCQFIFKDNYESFCHDHIQISDTEPVNATNVCAICDEKTEILHPMVCVKCPQCKSGFHSFCLRKQAIQSRNNFKCPLCNSFDEFRNRCQESDIFIPEKYV